jgi:M6 family metalloprotease-like protein
MMQTRIRAYGALGVLALLLTADLAAQQAPATPPRPGRREIPNLDISRDGAWRAKTRRVQESRRAALARRDIRALNGPGTAMTVTGDFVVPIVFLGYSDTTVNGATPVIGDTGQYRSLFFSANPTAEATPRPYSLKTYYEQVSNNNITFDGDLYGWINTPFTYAFVGNNCAAVFCGGFTTRFGAMLRAGLDSLNIPARQVDWGQFDNDGPDGLPNSGDDDGFVDFVTFVHPSLGGECGTAAGGQTGNRIWAHRWTMQAVSGSTYTTQTPRTGGGTNIRINDYTVQSARGGTSSCSAGAIMPIGTVAHETGHAFGIPDLYNSGNGPSEGIGEWGLMGSGNYSRPYSPSGWDAWSLLDLGWVHVDTLTTSRSVTLNPVQTSDTVLIAPMNGTDEYYLLENRAFLQSDTAQMVNAFSRPKRPGLLVWHVDPSIIASGRLSNSVNAGVIEGLRLVQADGLGDLQTGADRGDLGDSYPGSTQNHRLTYTSNPASKNNTDIVAGFVLDSIYQVDTAGAVKFRFVRSAPFRVTSAAAGLGAVITVNGITATAVEDVFAIGDSIHLSVADSQLVNGGLTRLVFLNWSDAGPRQHAIVSDGNPDTVTASFTTRYRLLYTANGSGTIGTSGPTSNTFVTAATPVTLTATPTGGATFTNWTGDTTTANASLVLPMGRPFNVTANFSGAVAVSYDQATDAILGVTPLSTPQANYLDDVGNNNGIYDLGDYLAFLKAEGLVTAPDVMARIMRLHSIAPRQEK